MDQTDELAQIAATLDSDPHSLDVPHVYGVSLSARHATLLLELEGALDRGADELLQEAAESGIDTLWAVCVHQAPRGDREA